LNGTSEINNWIYLLGVHSNKQLPLILSFLSNSYATIAYSGQQPWLQNGTIRDNILFGESYHPKRYDKIIETCGLKDDIELLPNGDLTQIGERGQNLSGGQKMRISIARAFYSSANVIILVS